MFKGSHEARASLNAALRAGQIKLPGPSVAIFRLLLDHTWYTERSYGFVNQVDYNSDYSIRGVDDIATLTGYGEQAVRRHLQALQDAKLIHRQPRPKWSGGREFDQITISWPTFHAEDEAEAVRETVSDATKIKAETVSQTTEAVRETVSFLDKKEKKDDDVATSGQGQNRASTSTRPAPTARAIYPAKDDFPALEDYLSDAEGARDELAARLGVAPVSVNVKALAKSWRAIMVQHDDREDTVSGLLEIVPADSPMWSVWGRKNSPVGFMLDEVGRFLASHKKKEVA